MARNIVICCDGTNNKFGVCNTNVVRLAQVLVQDSASQVVYYDPGVGTLPAPGFVTRLGQRLSTWRALAFGTDLLDKVGTAYAHLMEVWEPGDRVYLFGFSRGAYTVRVLAGLLYSLGLLPAGNTQLIPYVLRLFSASRKDPEQFYWKVMNQFRWSFARPTEGGDRHFHVDFMGLWDTVSSVGWVWEPATFPYTAKNPGVRSVRHAISLDERRWFFRQNRVSPAEGQKVVERWFPGVHSDIGGGYPEADGGLWRVTFEWMLDGAREAGLLVDESRLAAVGTVTPAPERPWAEPAHESLRGPWWLAEIFPKRVYSSHTGRRATRFGLGGHRRIREGDEIEQAALQRLRDGSYAPPNLSPRFLETVRAMADVPEFLAYAPPQEPAR